MTIIRGKVPGNQFFLQLQKRTASYLCINEKAGVRIALISTMFDFKRNLLCQRQSRLWIAGLADF